MRKIEKILISVKTGKQYYVKDLTEDFHTAQGLITKKSLQSENNIVKTNKDEKFILLKPNFADLWNNLQRGPQIMQHKDIGLILAKIGVNKNSKIVDAGGGSGSLCLSLANIAQQVYVYEINPEHYDVIAKNVKLFGIDNLELKQADVYKGIQEDNIDLITLDLPEPWRVIEHSEKALINGGFLVVYLPNLTQVKQFIDATRKTKIKVDETIELIERKWKIQDKIMRPEFQMLGHTGFLIFCRKL